MTPDPNKTYWWAYVHANRTLQLKRWFGDVKDYTDDCKDNPFVELVIEPFEAATREEAFVIANQRVLDAQNRMGKIKIGDKVLPTPEEKLSILADEFANFVEGDISGAKFDRIKKWVDSDKPLVVSSSEPMDENTTGYILKAGKDELYGLHHAENLKVV